MNGDLNKHSFHNESLREVKISQTRSATENTLQRQQLPEKEKLAKEKKISTSRDNSFFRN